MKYRSQTGWFFHFAVSLFTLTNIYLLVMGVSQRKLSMFLLGAALAALNCIVLLPVWFNTYYRLDRDSLYICSGLFTKITIPYTDIKSAKLSAGAAKRSDALPDRIELQFIYSGKATLTYLSPAKLREFYNLLKKRMGQDEA